MMKTDPSRLATRKTFPHGDSHTLLWDLEEVVGSTALEVFKTETGKANWSEIGIHPACSKKLGWRPPKVTPSMDGYRNAPSPGKIKHKKFSHEFWECDSSAPCSFQTHASFQQPREVGLHKPDWFSEPHLGWRPQCCTTAGHSPDPTGTAVFPTSKPPPVGKGSPDTRK